MTDGWTLERVEAAAPDPASWTAGNGLAGAAVWSDVGCDGALLWGACQGSGKNPYKVLVDVDGPRYKCSCPSRKFPCKHALGLMILWVGGRLVPGAPPAAAGEWAAGSKRVVSAPRPDGPPTPEQQAAAAGRLAVREERITDGLEELDRWLKDQVTAGLARSWTDPAAHFERMAARLVDAQAPGLAARVRELAPIAVSGEGWPGRLLEEFALLHLVVRAWGRRESLPAELAQTVRTVVGLAVPSEVVVAGEGVRGLWLVAGLRDVAEGKLTARRVWLRAVGSFTNRVWALVLTFAAYGQAPDTSLAPGTVVDAQVHFYPGSGNYRGLIGERFGERLAREVPGWAPPPASFDELMAAHRELLAANPWAGVSPASAVITVVRGDGVRGERGGGGGTGWRAQDPAGRQVPLVVANDLDLWRLHGLLAGRPGHVVGEWSGEGLRPTGVVTADGLELL